MKTFVRISILILALGFLSCVDRQESRVGEKYSTIVHYNDVDVYADIEFERRRTNRLLQRDTLYIFFEAEFMSDTIDININGQKTRTLYLTTSNIGIADVAQFGDISSIYKVEIVKNNGAPLLFELPDKRVNIWTVRFYNDTLRAQTKKYLPYYE